MRKIETPFLPFIWNGLNAIFIFVAGACNLVEKFVNQWYVDTDDRTLTWWIQDGLNNQLGTDGGVMTYTVIKIVFFTMVAWLLARNKIFFKV